MKVSKAILATFLATILTNDAYSSNGRKLEPFYQNIVLNNLVPSVTCEEHGADVLKKFWQVSKKSTIALENLRMNPCPIRSENDAKLFPSLETQVIFGVDDYLVPYVDNVVSTIPVSIFALFDLTEDETRSIVFRSFSDGELVQSLTIKFTMAGDENGYFSIYADDNQEPWQDTNLKISNIISTEAVMFDNDRIFAVDVLGERALDFYQLRNSLVNLTKCGGVKGCISENDFSMYLTLKRSSYEQNSLVIPKEVSVLETEVDQMNSCFLRMVPPMWQNVVFNYEESKLKRIRNSVFAGSQLLEKLYIPNTVKIINYNAFSYCKSLKTLILPDVLKTVDKNILSGCVSLEFLAVPDGVDVFYSIDSTSGWKGLFLYFIHNEMFINVAHITTNKVQDFINHLKVYKKSDVQVKHFDDGEFTVTVLNDNNVLKSVDDVIKTVDNIVILPEGITVLDYNFSVVLQTPKMSEAQSLKFPSTLRAIRHGESIEKLFGKNIKNIYIPAAIQEIFGRFLGKGALETVNIYGGTPQEREMARRLVEKSGFKGNVDFIDNI